MPNLSVDDTISVTQQLLNFASEQGWDLQEKQFNLILHNNKYIAKKGTDQQKIAYYRILNNALMGSRYSSFNNLYANLEIHFRIKCKPLLNNVSDLDKTNIRENIIHDKPLTLNMSR